MKPGDRARFFDSRGEWQRTGDIGDNDCYFMPATVEAVRFRGGQELVDLRFDHRPNQVSLSHFTDITKPIP